MASSTGPNLGILYGWTYRESGWKPGMDANLIMTDSVLQLSVLDHETTAPPGAPTDGDRYIIPSGATGVWSGKTNQITVWLDADSAWSYHTPKAGWQAWIVSQSAIYVFDGSNWAIHGSGTLPGTWSNPYVFGDGAAYMWFNATQGFFRGKVGSAPASDDEGNFIPFG